MCGDENERMDCEEEKMEVDERGATAEKPKTVRKAEDGRKLALLNLVPGHYLKDVLHYLYFDDLTSLRQTSSYFRDFIRDNKKTLIKSKREQKVDVKWGTKSLGKKNPVTVEYILITFENCCHYCWSKAGKFKTTLYYSNEAVVKKFTKNIVDIGGDISALLIQYANEKMTSGKEKRFVYFYKGDYENLQQHIVTFLNAMPKWSFYDLSFTSPELLWRLAAVVPQIETNFGHLYIRGIYTKFTDLIQFVESSPWFTPQRLRKMPFIIDYIGDEDVDFPAKHPILRQVGSLVLTLGKIVPVEDLLQLKCTILDVTIRRDNPHPEYRLQIYSPGQFDRILKTLLTWKKNLYKWYLKVDFDLSVFIERRYPDARLVRLVHMDATDESGYSFLLERSAANFPDTVLIMSQDDNEITIDSYSPKAAREWYVPCIFDDFGEICYDMPQEFLLE